jgi:bifunctional DNA-binding transcriptional regulator/antitoxin component of YhaV-PrlF toxin-antitoxin module
MGAAKVTSKGQITIPADIRNEWQIEPGDQLASTPAQMGGSWFGFGACA